jgi:hypothetical protein
MSNLPCKFPVFYRPITLKVGLEKRVNSKSPLEDLVVKK